MKRIALLLATLVVFAACAGDGGVATTTTGAVATTTTEPSTASTIGTNTTTPAAAGFPVTVVDDNGEVSVPEPPVAIVSLSAVATEMLFAIGAGPQVVAVDDQSNYPAEAPMTELSGISPNIEAILAYAPDLVVITFDPTDVVASLDAAGVPVLTYTAALSIEDVYRQIDSLGLATGHVDEAAALDLAIADGLEAAVEGAGGIGESATYFHEIDNTLYTVTSSTFFGEIYGLFGLDNIADPADEDGSAYGYPQLSAEYVVAADPDVIFLADTSYGESAETVAARPGWDVMTAVEAGRIVELDSDIASRWGPRIVELAEQIASGLTESLAG